MRAALAVAALAAVGLGVWTLAAQAGPDGAALYAEHCASCHGAALEGAEDWHRPMEDGSLLPPPHDASGHTWHHSDDDLRAYVRLGGAEALAQAGVPDFPSNMPAFGDVLDDAEIDAVLGFIKESWPEELREAQAERTRRDAR